MTRATMSVEKNHRSGVPAISPAAGIVDAAVGGTRGPGLGLMPEQVCNLHLGQPQSSVAAQLDRVLREADLQVLFQTIVSLETGRAIGFDAAVRGPSGSPLYAPALLFAAAQRCDRHADLERLALRRVLEDVRLNALVGAVFHTVSRAFLTGCAASGLPDATVRGVPLILTVRASMLGKPPNPDGLGALVGRLRAQDQPVGMDLLSVLLAGDAMLSPGCRPAWVKINRQVTEGIARDPQRQAWLRGLVMALRQEGVRCIAEGIESVVELRCLKALGLEYGQGLLIARPLSRPATTAAAEALCAIAPLPSASYRRRAGDQSLGDSLILRQPTPVAPETPNAEVFARFKADAALEMVPVVTAGVPIGMITRAAMIDSFARPYRAELYGRKPCRLFMDRDALIVDHAISLSALSRLASEGSPSYLAGGFIVTANGRYLGTASGQDLLREITSLQMDSARYANPLTQLPGNHVIDARLWDLIEAGADFTVCYADLDHFKPFNDRYGYAQGDELIQVTARVLADICIPETDFIGHIGGDDFILILRRADWRTCCTQALACFDREVRRFFNADDLERGGYIAENRQGIPEFQPLTCLSIGAVTILGKGTDPAPASSPFAISQLAAVAKKQAKAITGSALVWMGTAPGEISD